MKTADQIFDEAQEVKKKAMELLRADGRPPHRNSLKRAEYERLLDEEYRLVQEWAAADSRERKQRVA